MAISMMIVVSIIAHKRNYPTTREKFPSLKEIVKQGITSFWGLFFPFGIILGMRFGMFTPSEGGAVAVLNEVTDKGVRAFEQPPALINRGDF